jgi:hypothetical protein
MHCVFRTICIQTRELIERLTLPGPGTGNCVYSALAVPSVTNTQLNRAWLYHSMVERVTGIGNKRMSVAQCIQRTKWAKPEPSVTNTQGNGAWLLRGQCCCCCIAHCVVMREQFCGRSVGHRIPFNSLSDSPRQTCSNRVDT